ncbi:hypothetical protein AB0I28_12695 [Phytomonospora sp. NPDC050363]|uniref:hypothetical protein n=1 Tax=Phytomonospora sp. NPDC050363 TaxID=3155642 RepID=UPI0033FEBEE5
MKIKVSLTIEMTPEQMKDFYNEYGNARTAAEIREDVKEHVRWMIMESTYGEFFKSVELS